MGPSASLLLDGAAGAIFGGLATACAVWATIRHQVRRDIANRAEADARAAENREEQARDAAVEAAMVALGRLQGACMAFSMTASRRRLWPWERAIVKDEMVEVAASLAVARARLLHRWPDTNRALERCSEELVGAVAGAEGEIPKAVQETCVSIIGICREWLDGDMATRT